MELKREDFINEYPPVNSMNKDEVAALWEKKPLHLYLHIPFCIRKCGFCYYKSDAAGNRGVPDEYVAALRKEIQSYAARPEIQSRKIHSLYVGGGTPTLLTEAQMESIFTLALKSFDFADGFEFCCEARPGSETTFSKLALLKSLGLNRLSMGCQSLDEEVLKENYCNHGVQEFYTIFEAARKVGIRTINVDLLSGMVNQSIDSFLSSIDGVIALRPENIAIYKMEVYLNSYLYKKLRQGTIQLISDEAESEYVRKGYRKIRAAGYHQIDFFSFLTGMEHVHVFRRAQWSGEEMLGLGASAYSWMNSFLFQNESQFSNYVEKINRGESVVTRAHRISQKERMIQRIVMGLKNTLIPREKFVNDFGDDPVALFPEEFRKLEDGGFITINNDTIECTFEGAIFADDIAREFFLPEHRQMMLGHYDRTGTDV